MPGGRLTLESSRRSTSVERWSRTSSTNGARNRFRGIVLNEYDEAVAHGAVDELNAAGLLKPFIEDAEVSSGD